MEKILNELNLLNRPDQETEPCGMVQLEDNHRHATVAKQLLFVFSNICWFFRLFHFDVFIRLPSRDSFHRRAHKHTEIHDRSHSDKEKTIEKFRRRM